MKKALLIVTALGASLAFAASSYNVTLYRATNVNGTELKPGTVKVELAGDKVVLKQGKTTVEAPVTVETKSAKFVSTQVGYDAEHPDQIQDIRLAGTSTVVTFGTQAKSAATASK
jgi:phage baseplate assembly protein gpV